MRRDFGKFPPAQKERSRLWTLLANLEGRQWFERGKRAFEAQNEDRARIELHRVLKYYRDSEWGKKSTELLERLAKWTPEMRQQALERMPPKAREMIEERLEESVEENVETNVETNVEANKTDANAKGQATSDPTQSNNSKGSTP